MSTGACSSAKEPDAPSIPCSAQELGGLESVSSVTVRLSPTLPPQVQADVANYLGRLWRGPVQVSLGEDLAGVPGDAILVSSSAAAKALATATAGQGYTLARSNEGGRRALVVFAENSNDLVSGTYALLEELGIRFFHPMQELVPELPGPMFPRTLAARRTPMAKVRGLQMHLLHPLEYLRTLHEPGEANLAEARKLIDWLVKTGQNHLQWPLLGSAPWDGFRDHARRIIEYAHSRGVTVGCMVQLFEKASLQRAFVLVQDETQLDAQLSQNGERLMQVPWDEVEFAMGEFFAEDPDVLVRMLDAATAKVLALKPDTRIGVHNHVGNYPNLYPTYRGQRTYFYHLPQYADPRIGQTVHTLFWFDLYRPGGMYKHTDFAFQRDFIFAQLSTARRVRYFPESAYWIGTDIDVPAFLPEFIESRWTDIHRLNQDIRAKGLPPLDGHITFSSGHEWGYWLTDYLVAKMLWEPDAPLERFLSHYTQSFGSCGASTQESLGKFVELQRRYLFEQNLVPYLSGEDHTVDLGAAAGIEIRTPRVPFHQLATAPEADRAAFEAKVLAPLGAFTAESKLLEDQVAARCRGSDATLKPWCLELEQGMRIVRLRLEHSQQLYRAVLAFARGNPAEAGSLLERARSVTTQAATTIAAREQGYRFDVDRLTASYANITRYPFGYLRQSHTQCYWRRQEEQARTVIEDGSTRPSIAGLPSCGD